MVDATTAAADAMADRRIVSLILHLLSGMKYKERRQRGPDQPVEFLEFRPTLVPSILVNKLWAEEGTSILWKRYPHVPALKGMTLERRQWYANKVEGLYVLGPSLEDNEDLSYLEELVWPRLRNLELEVDWRIHGKSLGSVLHPGIKHLELSGPQSGNAKFVAQVIFPALFTPCKHLESIQFGPDTIDSQDPVHNQALGDLLDSVPSIAALRIKNTGFFGNGPLFARLSNRPGLEVLEIDLDPGVQLQSLFSPTALSPSFPSLKRLHVMCYPEVAFALPARLRSIKDLQLDVARVPTQPAQDSDISILDDLLNAISQCSELESLRVNIGQLGSDAPSALSYPQLSGSALVQLATGCFRLQDLNLLASEPFAIDGSRISSTQFEEFCRQSPLLENFSLKVHPGTVGSLEQTALQSLGKYCPMLTMLRIKMGSHLPGIHTEHDSTAAFPLKSNSSDQIDVIRHDRTATATCDIILNPITPSTGPHFPHLTHLALSRPQSPLSIATSAYRSPYRSKFSPVGNVSLEDDLVRPWAECLVAHFPRLEILEAWGDSTGQDNESLNYFLPLEEPLASIWEFLSGVEQDLWVDEDMEDLAGSIEDWDADYEDDFNFDSLGSGEDWKRASLINEYPTEQVMFASGHSEGFEEEPEGSMTPGRTLDTEGLGFFENIDGKHKSASVAT